ncbi:MAG: JmjC domain-containing protein [Sphingosinicella sp.]
MIDGVEEISDSLRELAIDLEGLLRDRVRMNCYASFGSDQGFGVHWDDHDVFALQLAGRKKWSLYGFSRAAPLALDVEATDLPPPEPIDEIEVHPGDVLYVPRGAWHTVFGLGEPSLHLAIGVTKRKGVDFLSWLIDRMRDDPVVRSDIPRFEGEGNALAYEARLKSIVADLLAQEDLLGQFLREQDEDAPPPLVTNLPWVISADALEGDDPTVIWRGSRARFELTDDGQVVVHTAGKEFEFAAPVRPLIERLVDRPARISELQAEVPAAARVVPKLIRELARAGLIELVIRPPPSAPSQSDWTRRS